MTSRKTITDEGSPPKPNAIQSSSRGNATSFDVHARTTPSISESIQKEMAINIKNNRLTSSSSTSASSTKSIKSKLLLPTHGDVIQIKMSGKKKGTKVTVMEKVEGVKFVMVSYIEWKQHFNEHQPLSRVSQNNQVVNATLLLLLVLNSICSLSHFVN